MMHRCHGPSAKCDDPNDDGRAAMDRSHREDGA